jgi:UDP-N-acetylglucosamine 2-epimerase (non-hydrolysing)
VTKIACIIGTRPEAIKMAPIILKLREQPWARVIVVTTAQHRQLADDVLDLFGIVPDIDLDLMQHGQSLSDLLARALTGLDDVIARTSLDLVMAQGDTTSVMATAIACFHRHVPFLHVEAGLRSFDLDNPFPEELNRIVASRIAALHFAPTTRARANLLNEGIPDGTIVVTGNSVIDALYWALSKCPDPPATIEPSSRLLLVTVHRRENFGEPLSSICLAVRSLIDAYPDIGVLWPVHPNPNVASTVREMLGDLPRVQLVEPLRYGEFVDALRRSYLVLTDSGGVQEEAPAIGRPVFVLRRETERPEAIEAGVARLVGTDAATILKHTRELLDDPASYAKMSACISPYGDGYAAERIVQKIQERFVNRRVETGVGDLTQ